MKNLERKMAKKTKKELEGFKAPPLEVTKPKKKRVKRRKLTAQEKMIYRRQIKDFEEMIDKWEYDIGTIIRDLELGYDLWLKEKKVAGRQKKGELLNNISTYKNNIKVLRKQLRYGVPVK